MKLDKKMFFIGIVIGLALVGGYSVVQPSYACGTEGDCPTPTPIVMCSETPIPTITTTPIPTVTETPTVTPTVTPTISPTTTPTPSQPSSSSNPTSSPSSSSSQAPQPPVCNIPFSAPILQGFQRITSSSVSFSWWKSTDADVQQQSLVYGYLPDELIYGVILSANSTNYTVQNLLPNHIVYAQVWAMKNGCASKSNIIDP